MSSERMNFRRGAIFSEYGSNILSDTPHAGHLPCSFPFSMIKPQDLHRTSSFMIGFLFPMRSRNQYAKARNVECGGCDGAQPHCMMVVCLHDVVLRKTSLLKK